MLKKLLTDTWSFFNDRAATICLIILPIVIPTKIIDILCVASVQNTASAFSSVYKIGLPLLIDSLGSPIYSIAVVFYIASTIDNEKGDIPRLWKLGMKYWLRYGILAFLILLMMCLGFILFVIPSIIFTARYAVAEFDLLLNKSEPVEAMKRSWFLTKNHVGIIIMGAFAITVVLDIPYYLISFLLHKTIAANLIDAVLDVAYSIFSVLYTIFLFHIYNLAKEQQQVGVAIETEARQ